MALANNDFVLFFYFSLGFGYRQFFELRDFQVGKGGEFFKGSILLPQLQTYSFLVGLSPGF
jgi:hypothetical protein